MFYIMNNYHYLNIQCGEATSMIIREIRNLTPRQFEELHNIYVSTFPLESTKKVEVFIDHIKEMLRNDYKYHLYSALEDRTIIGISLLYVFEYLKMGFA
jgi:hypothetical protein